jgi:DNA-binding transcriptional MocR family regulator
MSARRARALAKLLKGHDVLVVEDDHSGAISSSPDVSLGAWLAGQTVHITSFSKSHGPDLRLASIAGPADVVDELVDRRTLGPGWSSRILQAVLLDLLTDPVAVSAVERARTVYAERRRCVTTVLDRVGVGYTGSDGINLWVATPDEQATLVGLAAQGIAGAPGSPFVVAPDGTDHVRLTVGVVVDDHSRLATQIADAIPAGARARGRRTVR